MVVVAVVVAAAVTSAVAIISKGAAVASNAFLHRLAEPFIRTSRRKRRTGVKPDVFYQP